MSMLTGNEKTTYVIQVVDDDSILREVLCLGMSKAGFFVSEASNGLEAINDFEKIEPDLILLDIIMPDMSGFEVCKRIRLMPGGDRVPIIMVTGQDDYKSVNKAFECGATDFVVKPINPLLLSYRIRHILRANQALSDLTLSQVKLDSAIEMAKFKYWEWSLADDKLTWGKDMCVLCGIEEDQAPLLYTDFLKLVHVDDKEEVDSTLEDAIKHKTNFSFEHRLINSSGRECFLKHDGTFLKSSKGLPVKILFTCLDVTERIVTEEKIKFLAYYDRLTGLPNRVLFKEHLGSSISKSRRNNQFLSVLFIDIDNFRTINDTFGREIGDILLKKISERIRDSLRRSDTTASVREHDVTARFGGDEFGLILESLKDVADAAIVARRIIEFLTRVIRHDGHEIFLNCRIGLAVFPEDGDTVTELMKAADSALSSAKELERNSYQFFTADLNTKAFARYALETSLRRAVERNEFFLLYQPQIDLNSGELIGVEALIRWAHPEMGIVSPIEFISLAENCGLIVPIGEWVIETASKQCKDWQDEGYNIRMAINLSAGQFSDGELMNSIKRIFRKTNVNPKLVELEITESMLMNDAEGSISLMSELSELGCTIAIDDFGTGYSSLNYLKRFPVNVLKVDRSFVKDVAVNEDDALIVKAIVTLAHNLNLEVVAEGVEDKEHIEYLKQLKCDVIQGYYVSKPAYPDDVKAFFPDWNLSSIV